MPFNLVVWAWSDGYQTAAERRKRGVKYQDVMQGFAENEGHPAMREFDFHEFEAAVEAALGPETEDGPYLVERYPNARVYVIWHSKVMDVVPIIGNIARKFRLTSAEC